VTGLAIAPDNQQAWIVAKKDNILRGAFRDGQSLTFETTLRALVTRIDLTTTQELITTRLDINNHGQPSVLIFSAQGNYVFVTMQGNNRLLVIDPVTNAEITRADTGLAPQGIVIDPVTDRVFTKDLLSRTVSVFDAAAMLEQGSQTLPVVATINTVTNESLTPEVLQGKRIFYNARDTRMARDGYLSCVACHLDGEPDGQIWDLTHLGEGLRNTPDLRGRRGMGHGNVHWTANFDEIQDFEVPIRLFFEGSGFMSDDDLFSGTRLSPLGDPKAGFSAELDALAAYAAIFDAVPRSPYRAADGSLTVAGTAGRVVFQGLGCQQCHPEPDFTDTTMHDIGTIKASSGQRLDQTLTGIDTPTLKGIWTTAPYLHDGSAPTLADVFEQGDPDSPHGIVRSLNETDRANLIAYLLQIDENGCQHSPIRPPPPANLSYTIYLPVILSANNNCP
jgi:YVTN family beta-propeller protein